MLLLLLLYRFFCTLCKIYWYIEIQSPGRYLLTVRITCFSCIAFCWITSGLSSLHVPIHRPYREGQDNWRLFRTLVLFILSWQWIYHLYQLPHILTWAVVHTSPNNLTSSAILKAPSEALTCLHWYHRLHKDRYLLHSRKLVVKIFCSNVYCLVYIECTSC